MDLVSVFGWKVEPTMFLALCALVVPLATVVINNIYGLVLRMLDIRREYRENNYYHVRDAFEKYLMYAGKCIERPDAEGLHDYGSAYYTALMYAYMYDKYAEELPHQMSEANKLMLVNQYDEAAELINKISATVPGLLNRLYKKRR